MWDALGRHDGTYTNINSTTPPVALGAAGAEYGSLAATFSATQGGIGMVPWATSLNNNQFALEGWVKTSVLNGESPFSNCNTNGGVWINSINNWWYGDCIGGYFGNNGNVNTKGQIVAGQWSHIVVNYDGTRTSGGNYYPFTLYVNGATDGYIWGGSGLNNGGPLIVGGRGGQVSGTLVDRLFDGQVCDVAVYQRVLPAAEILGHYNVVVTNRPPSFTSGFTSQILATGRSLT